MKILNNCSLNKENFNLYYLFLGSYEQSPRLTETFENSVENDGVGIGNGENQLREDLAEAMLETSAAAHRAPGMYSLLFMFVKFLYLI